MSGTSPFNKNKCKYVFYSCCKSNSWSTNSSLLSNPITFLPYSPSSWQNKMFSYIEESLCFKCRYLHNTDCDGYADRPIVCSHFVFPSYLRSSSRHTQPHLPAFLKIIAGKFERLEFHAKSNPSIVLRSNMVQIWCYSCHERIDLATGLQIDSW